MRTFRRILTILPAVLLQLLLIFAVFVWLAPWAIFIFGVLSIFSVLFVVYLITKREETTYKILWLMLILAFPIIGSLLYLFFGNKRTMKPLKRKLEKCPPLPRANDSSQELYRKLEEEDKRISQIIGRVKNDTGFELYENEGAKYYPLGDDLFPDLICALEKAEKFIFIEYFILAKGFMLDSIINILERKAAAGVDVRVLYDDFGSVKSFSGGDAKKLRKKGIKCAAFNRIVFLKGTVNCRDHRKITVVDGKVAFSGGINLADEYINRRSRFGHWKDIGFKLTGKAAESYTRMFVEFWNAFTKDPIPDDEWFAAENALPASGSISDPSDCASGSVSDPSDCASGSISDPSDCASGSISDPSGNASGSVSDPSGNASGSVSDTSGNGASGSASDSTSECASGSVSGNDGMVISYYDSPIKYDGTSNELFIDILSQAKDYAWFFTPYLLPGDALTDAFTRAAERGVDVRIIIPGIPDKKLIYRMSRSFYPVLLSAGVKIYEYTPGFVHAKGCVSDDKICTIGSVNLDYRSLFLHFENNTVFYRASILFDLKKDFENTLEKCRERTTENYKMNFGKWLIDGFLRIIAPLC